MQSLHQEAHQREILQAEIAMLKSKIQAIESENEAMRMQKAALQLRLLGQGGDARASSNARPMLPTPRLLEPFERIPVNVVPTCIADMIFQTFAEARWSGKILGTESMGDAVYPEKPDPSVLFDDTTAKESEPTSQVVGDIVRSYTEIDTLPKQVAVHYIISQLLKVCQ
jgi:hypothetical protein